MGKKRLLYSDNCGYCDIVKAQLKDEILRGEIELINIDRDSSARELATMFGGVPTLTEENNGILRELVIKTEG